MQTSLISKTSPSGRRFDWSGQFQSPAEAEAPLAHALLATGGAARGVQPPAMPLDVSSRFGQRLRELRHQRNLTQSRMATEFGIDRSFISDVERGKKSISLPMLEVISLGMKMTLSELLQSI